MRKMGMAVLLLLCCGGCSWMKMPKIRFSEDKPEVKVQKRIAVVLKSGDDVKFYRAMSDLTDTSRSAGWDAQRLLTEVMNYYPRIDSNNELTVYYRMLENLRIPRSAMVAAAAPRLDSTGSEVEVTKSILAWAAPGVEQGKTDFTQFAQYVQQAQAPASLVLWMYERDPSAAMWQMVSVYGDRMDPADRQSLALSEHVVSEILWRQRRGLARPGQFETPAAEQLHILSRFKEWYVRLYVAEVLAAHPRFGTWELIQLLRKDEHPLVSRVAQTIRVDESPTTRTAAIK